MRFEITETAFNQATYMPTVYRYDCFIDDVFMTFGTWTEKQELHTIYQYFIKVVLREWKTKYKNKYTMNKITKQDIELTLKQANTLVRLQKMEEDFQ